MVKKEHIWQFVEDLFGTVRHLPENSVALAYAAAAAVTISNSEYSVKT
jgi:hypothetical protein